VENRLQILSAVKADFQFDGRHFRIFAVGKNPRSVMAYVDVLPRKLRHYVVHKPVAVFRQNAYRNNSAAVRFCLIVNAHAASPPNPDIAPRTFAAVIFL
jgi:hypothetical protein